MKTPKEVKQKVKANERWFAREQKASSCCGPTCCGGSNEKKDNQRKER